MIHSPKVGHLDCCFCRAQGSVFLHEPLFFGDPAMRCANRGARGPIVNKGKGNVLQRAMDWWHCAEPRRERDAKGRFRRTPLPGGTHPPNAGVVVMEPAS